MTMYRQGLSVSPSLTTFLSATANNKYEQIYVPCWAFSEWYGEQNQVLSPPCLETCWTTHLKSHQVKGPGRFVWLQVLQELSNYTDYSYITEGKQTPRIWFTVNVTQKESMQGSGKFWHSPRTCCDMLCKEAKYKCASLKWTKTKWNCHLRSELVFLVDWYHLLSLFLSWPQ